jgi:PAS domain S-box-containing protein
MAKILVVDDEKNIRKLLSYILEKEKHIVFTAANFSEAVTIIKHSHFDVILSDILMPGLSGLDLLRKIQILVPETPVIMMTGYPTLESAAEAVREKAIDYITKPIVARDIYTAVARALQVKKINDEKKRLEEENRDYRQQLEKLIVEQSGELKKLASAVTQSPVSIVITNAQGDIEYTNPKFTQVTGFSAREVLGRNPRVLKSGYSPKGFYKDLWKKIAKGETWQGEFYNKKKDGTFFWERAVISPLKNEKGSITHFLAVKEDISEKKELEKQMVDIIEDGQRKLGRDLHDGLGQELTGIAFMAKSLVQKVKKNLPDETKNFEMLVDHVNRSIAQVKNISKGLYPASLEQDGLQPAIKSMAENINQMYLVHCNFNFKNVKRLPDPASEIHLFRIAQEALNNTIKHARAKNVTINLSQVKNIVKLQIIDDGIGIGESMQKNKGLGLSIMKNRARLINATLDVRLNDQGGTLVECLLGLRKGI